MVGLPDKAVGEARERVRAALTAMGLALPPRRVLINLAPADLLKEGSHFDLPIALCVLAAMDVLPREDLAGFAAVGELSLDGTLNPVAGVLPAAIAASARGLGLICPAEQGGEAAWAGQVEVLALPDLLCAVNHFRGTQVLTPPPPAGVAERVPGPDLSEVKGMEAAKRAVEVAAAGGHNLLLVGPPGAGKSMLACRMPGLLPDLTPAEALEVSTIHSVAGLLVGGLMVKRPPYREPHHSASPAALTGGGCDFHPQSEFYTLILNWRTIEPQSLPSRSRWTASRTSRRTAGYGGCAGLTMSGSPLGAQVPLASSSYSPFWRRAASLTCPRLMTKAGNPVAR